MTEGSNTEAALKRMIWGIEEIESQKKDLDEEKKAIFEEAKAAGFDVKVLRKVLARRKRDREDVENEDHLIAQYEAAIRGRA